MPPQENGALEQWRGDLEGRWMGGCVEVGGHLVRLCWTHWPSIPGVRESHWERNSLMEGPRRRVQKFFVGEETAKGQDGEGGHGERKRR